MSATWKNTGTLALIAAALVSAPAFTQGEGSSAQDENGCAAWNPHPERSSSIRWSGQCKDGWLEGPGTLEWLANGQPTETLATTMRRGRASGYTRHQIFQRGTVSEITEADYLNGVAQGYGQWRDVANGVRYLGEFGNGKFDGLGTLFRADGSRIEGQFHQGMADGFATETEAGGRMILGIEARNEFNGPGIVYSTSRTRLETTFTNGDVRPGAACRQFAANGTASVGTVVARQGAGSVTCKPSPGTDFAASSGSAATFINSAAKAHGYPAQASAANPYAYLDLVMRKQAARLQSSEAEFAKLAEQEAIPLPDGCVTDGTSDSGKTSAVSIRNRCGAPVNVNVCVRMAGTPNPQRLAQRVAPDGTARLEFGNPRNADYQYEFSYCRPDRTQTLDNCLAACP